MIEILELDENGKVYISRYEFDEANQIYVKTKYPVKYENSDIIIQ